jgi:replicative DNA helicase
VAQRKLDTSSLSLTPPQNNEAEMCALGAMMLSEAKLEILASSLEAEDFYVPAHAEVFRALRSLYMSKKPVDLVTVRDELIRRGTLNEIGGPDYLVQMMDRTPTTTNAESYAEIVRDKAVLRRLENVGRDIVGIVHDPEGDAPEKVNKAESLVYEVGQKRLGTSLRPVHDIARVFFEDVDHLYNTGEPILGLQTDFIDLDRLTTGFFPGDLVIVAARPAMGKTSLVLSMALNVARQRVGNVAVFSLEMTGDQLVRRLISTIAEVPMGVLRKSGLSERDYEKLTDASEEIYDLPLFIDDHGDVSPMEMRSKCRRLRASGGLALVVVDYLQLMRGNKAKPENRTQEIGDIARSLKLMAKELGCPVVALSQLNRGVENRPNKRPMLSDLRESGSIEAEADMVMMIYRDSYYESGKDAENAAQQIGRAEAAELIIAKHRSGPTGTVLLAFQPSYTKFSSMREEDKDEYWRSLKNRGGGADE